MQNKLNLSLYRTFLIILTQKRVDEIKSIVSGKKIENPIVKKYIVRMEVDSITINQKTYSLY